MPNGTITYSIDYTNAGLIAATGATISMRVPAYTTFEPSASDTDWSDSDTDGVWTLDASVAYGSQ